MATISAEIHNQSFSIDRKGYDVDEVDVFLEHVADEIDNLNNQIADLQDQLNDSRFDGFDTPAKPVEEAPVAAPAPSSAPAQDFSQELDEANARIRELESQLEEKQADGQRHRRRRSSSRSAPLTRSREGQQHRGRDHSGREGRGSAHHRPRQQRQAGRHRCHSQARGRSRGRARGISGTSHRLHQRRFPQARRDRRRLSGFRRCGALRRHHRCDGAGPGSYERRACDVFHAPDGQRRRGGGNPHALCGGEGSLGFR